MPYDILATSRTPMLVVYLLDVSASMRQMLAGKCRIDVVSEALQAALRQMIFRSTKGRLVSPRYRIAIYAYSDQVYDLMNGVKTISDVAAFGPPELSPQRTTDTALAFAAAERLLQRELPGLQACPAPLVCHMTDGEYTGDDPEPVVRRIMQMAIPDGRVLVENIFLSERFASAATSDLSNWPGVQPQTPLDNAYAEKLRALSSPLPPSYRVMMLESGFHLAPDAVMMLPGLSPELVAMGFQMSAATPIHAGVTFNVDKGFTVR